MISWIDSLMISWIDSLLINLIDSLILMIWSIQSHTEKKFTHLIFFSSGEGWSLLRPRDPS